MIINTRRARVVYHLQIESYALISPWREFRPENLHSVAILNTDNRLRCSENGERRSYGDTQRKASRSRSQ